LVHTLSLPHPFCTLLYFGGQGKTVLILKYFRNGLPLNSAIISSKVLFMMVTGRAWIWNGDIKVLMDSQIIIFQATIINPGAG
jgi:hypothetical protein